MKKYLILSSVFFCMKTISAQQKLDAYSFQVNEQVYYSVLHAKPASELHFYSESYGGKLVHVSKSNDKGELMVNIPKETKVSFVNNYEVLPKAGSAGKGCLQFFPPKEFILQTMKATQKENQIEISFDASVYSPNQTYVEIWKSEDGLSYSLFREIKSLPATLEHFSVVDNFTSPSVFYKIKVQDVNKGMRYFSPALPFFNENSIVVYPTQALNTIHINVPDSFIDLPYEIHNSVGAKVYSGIFKERIHQVDVSSFSKGMYILTLPKSFQKESVKFIKE